MKVIVLGLGISGKAAAHFLNKRGDKVLGVDRIVQTFEEIQVVSESSPIQLEGIDLVVKSPGITQTHPWVVAARARNVPIIGEIDLALAELKKKDK
ncbi:MAG TPA: hypothetical protein VIH61_10180, partial [Waddliaceae bacterium]